MPKTAPPPIPPNPSQPYTPSRGEDILLAIVYATFITIAAGLLIFATATVPWLWLTLPTFAATVSLVAAVLLRTRLFTDKTDR